MTLESSIQTRDGLLRLADRFRSVGDLDAAAACLLAAIDLSQTHLHGLFEDPAVDRRAAAIATAAFGPRRVRVPPTGRRLRVGFVMRHLLDHRGGGKSYIYIIDKLRDHGFDTFLYVPELDDRSELQQRVLAAGIPLRVPPPDRRPLALAASLRTLMLEDGIDIAFNYDMGDWLGGLLALSGGDVPITVFHHNADHLMAAGIHTFECHLALRRIALRPCRRHGETARCHYLPLPGTLHAREEPSTRLTRAAEGLPEVGPLTLTVTTLSKLVGQTLYFESLDTVLQRHPDVHHLIVGDGDPRQFAFVREQVRRMTAAARVHILGRRTDVPALLRLADVFVDSHPIGGMTACMEAMQAGLPVLTLSENRDPLFSGEEALELPECIAPTRAEFVARLERLVTDAPWRRELGGKLRAIYARVFDPDAVVNQYAAFLRELPAECAAHSQAQLATSGQRLLYPLTLGNPNERRLLDYACDAFDLACVGLGGLQRGRTALRVACECPGILRRVRFWSCLLRGVRTGPTGGLAHRIATSRATGAHPS